ncbi:MAG: ABC-type dipeptide/oligopeptide/nickel transport system permease subunit [Myxococcota bacterium]|jgi:ABC-type dipeptide/oligopeptide/nickel transport system permease subunit
MSASQTPTSSSETGQSPAAAAGGSAKKVGRSPGQEAWRRFKKNRAAVVFLGVFIAFASTAIAAQIIELVQGSPFTYELTLAEQGIEGFEESSNVPSTAHWQNFLGTTAAGKSVLVRVFHGTKVAFVVGTFGAGLSVLIGMTLGLFAGFLGGWVDEVVQYLYSTLASIPYLLLILALAFLIRQGPISAWYVEQSFAEYISLGLFNIVLVIGLTSWVTLCRLIRAEVKKVRELEYVQAAVSLGYSRTRILFRHVLPNVFHLVIINFSLTFVTAIKSEVILTFLGVGVDKEPSWGQMIADAKSELMRGIWWPLLASGGALFLLALSVNYVGDALRDALDPRLKD